MELIIRICTNAFILIMLFFMVCWDWQATNPIKKYWMPKLQPVFLWLGLTHTWNMFAPDPPLYNVWPKIKIYLKNGEFIIWEPTPYSELNAFEKIQYKKFHKFYYEVARSKTSFYSKIDFINYLLHKHQLKDKCVKLEIYRVSRAIPPINNPSNDLPIANQQLIYTHNI